MVDTIAEHGYEKTSVSLVCSQAKVSRRTFYETFPSFEECFLAVLDDGMETMAAVMVAGFEGEGDWLDALLRAEAAVLGHLDDDPQFARVLLVDALGAGSWALGRRQDNVTALRDLVVERFKDTPLGGDFPPMAASGVMASLLGIMHEHLLHREPAPLITLLGPLMGVIVTPYLDTEDVAREVRRGEQLAREIQAGRVSPARVPSRRERAHADEHPELRIPAQLASPNARRMRECLLYIAAQRELGISPSNREIAAGIYIAHASQVSLLLANLTAEGLVFKRSEGVGKRNSWWLTERGEEISRVLQQ